MSDIDILKQLLSGNHLESKDLARARVLVYGLSVELKRRG